MNKLTAFILLFTLALPNWAFQPAEQKEDLKWYDWNNGYAKGMKEKKIILVDAYTDWCGWCKRMDRDTYANAEVIKKLNKHFIPIKFNPEVTASYLIDTSTYSNRQLHGMLSNGQATGYPTTYFILPTQNKLFAVPGYEGPEKFMATLDRMLKEAGIN